MGKSDTKLQATQIDMGLQTVMASMKKELGYGRWLWLQNGGEIEGRRASRKWPEALQQPGKRQQRFGPRVQSGERRELVAPGLTLHTRSNGQDWLCGDGGEGQSQG